MQAASRGAASPEPEPGAPNSEGQCCRRTAAEAEAAQSGNDGGAAGGRGVASRATPRPVSPGEAVGRDAPHIPNVVEYHLKVKKPQKERRLRPAQQPAADTGHTLVRATLEMRQDKGQQSPLSGAQRKELTLRLCNLSVDSNVFEGSSDLPQVFQVKYLGSHDARGLWGIRHTRKPVDELVSRAKGLGPSGGKALPFVKLVVGEDGVGIVPLGKRRDSLADDALTKVYPIESISYGVQDLVYTRVFSMIVVRETDDFRRMSPFECHAFVCESKLHARQMTYALAAAFQIYSQCVKDRGSSPPETDNCSKGFALQLKNPGRVEGCYTLCAED